VIFPACQIRATASGISRRLAELGLHPGGYRVGQRVLTLVVGVQVDQRGTAGRVAHAFHQLTEVGAGLGDQAVARVAQVMKVNVNAGRARAGTQTRRRKLPCRSGLPVGLVNSSASGSGV
jgi:hypothetical protein